jgi:hypothetical protein
MGFYSGQHLSAGRETTRHKDKAYLREALYDFDRSDCR